MPNPSCTEGRQNTVALTYSSARRSRVRSPSSATESPRPSSAWRRESASHSGPRPTMRTWTPGTRARRMPAARRRSGIRLRGYMRATLSTTGAPRGRRGTRQNWSSHTSRSIGSGTTASRSSGTPYSRWATSAE